MTHPDLLLLLLADARLPVGGHTQSGSLEGAVMAGLGAADVPSYLRARLLGVTRTEAGTAVAARHCVADGGSLAEVDRAWQARTVTPALRAASRTQALSLLRLARGLWPAIDGVGLPDGPGRATVLGALGGLLGLGSEQVARLVAYDDVQTVCAAALKLLPLDPAVATGWVSGALPAVEDVVGAVAGIKDATEVPAVASPQIEAWAQAHARTTRRLFRA